MKDRNQDISGALGRCLTSDDLYRYIASPPGQGSTPGVESHLAKCPDCAEELAQLLKMLHPESDDSPAAVLPPTDNEIAQTLALIQEVARKEAHQTIRRRWTRWAAAAAAAIALLGAGAGGYWYYKFNESQRYLGEARAKLEEIYEARSPDGLRLDLPFRSAGVRRAAAESSLNRAEKFFALALGAREDLPEAHLGLAAIYLKRLQFTDAHEEFQKALDGGAFRMQALVGRGVVAYEEARRAEDPVARRGLLSRALADFDDALTLQPGSAEARYNRIWILYETGRHQELLTEIDTYLSGDAASVWADKLRDLQTRIRLNKTDAINKEVNRAALTRDQAVLDDIVRLLPEEVPRAIRSALIKSLRLEGTQPAPGTADSAGLRWAAETLEAGYSAATGDQSWRALFDFYKGLTPGQREIKKSLDQQFDTIIKTHQARDFATALQGSKSLEREYSRLRDYWQLFSIHSLRGNCFYYQADFQRAEFEYGEMLRLAKQTEAPELRATALTALFAAYAQQIRPDDEEICISELRMLAERYNLDSRKASAAEASGSLHLILNQLNESVRDYTAALGFAYRARDEGQLERLLEILIIIMNRLGRSEDAQSLCAEAVEMMAAFEKDAGPTDGIEVVARRLNLICREGELALQMGDLDRAGATFERGLASPLGEMRELEGRMRFGLAQVRLAKKRFTDAGILLDECLALAVSGGYEELKWQAAFLQGKLLEERGDSSAALSAFSRSIDTLESMRRNIASFDLRQQFLTSRFDPYKEIVSLLYHTLHDEQKALEFAGRAKSMTLQEYLNGASGSDRKQIPDCAETLQAIAIDYFFTADGLLAFVSDSGRQEVVELKSSRSELEAEVKAFLAATTGRDEAAFGPLSRKLYATLVEPVFRFAGNENHERLLIFPDGPLHLLPFGGLQDPQGRFLLEKITLSYAPSRSVLHRCLSMERGSAASHSRTVLLLDGTATLPGASRELARLTELYQKNCRLLTARDLDAAGRLAAEAEIFHFAGHATAIKGKPVLLLSSGSQPVYLDSGSIGSWRLRKNRLVTLAGCETGIGPQAEGETPWGLIPAFLNAGAPALLVSMLPVDDSSTVQLTSRFYELLAGSISKASALQKAQLSLLAQARASGRLNPSSWLPYVLIGDPR
jgi:CHAT domain-containing protein